MTKRRTAAAADELIDADRDPAGHITEFFQSLGDGAAIAVSVYAVDPQNRLKRSFLFQLPDVRELTGPHLMEQLLEKYGAGEYIAEGRDAGGVIRFCPRFSVGTVKSGRPEVPVPPTREAMAPGSASPDLLGLLERNTRALEALIARPAPSLAEQLKDFAAVREIFAPPPAPAAAPFDFAKMIELVQGVFTLRDTLGDAPAADNPLAVLARSLAPALTKIAERAVDQAALAPARPAAVESQPPAAPAEGGDMFGQGALVTGYVTELLRFAEQGLEPEAAAQRIVGTLSGFPQPMADAVLDWLNDEQFVAALAKLDARAAQYGPWLTAVVDRVLDEFGYEASSDAPAAQPVNGAQPVAAD